MSYWPIVPTLLLAGLVGCDSVPTDATVPMASAAPAPATASAPISPVAAPAPHLSEQLAGALELLQRPIEPYYLPPGKAGRLKQNYHVYTRLGRLSDGWPAAPQSDKDIALADLAKHLDRSPAALTKIYDLYRPFLPLALSTREYAEGPVSLYVETLLKTHREITSTPGWEGVFGEMSAALERPRDPSGYCNAVQCGVFIRRLAAVETLDALHSPCEADADSDYADYCGYRNAYWFYAFWYRRHLEGNMDAVHGILEDIDRTYGTTIAAVGSPVR